MPTTTGVSESPRAPATFRWPPFVIVLALAGLANLLLAAPLPIEVRLLPALVLFLLLPGHLFVSAVFDGPNPGPLERGLLALGCGYVLAALLALGLFILFRPLSSLEVIVGGDVLTGGLLLLAVARGADLRPRLGRPGWPILLLLAVGAPLRLINLGYSEFQGDEVKVVLRAFALLQGVPDTLLAQRKPPAEILVNAIFDGALGGVTELDGRLPFALAGVAGVLACACLGGALFGARAGLAAGLLLAVNGYVVAFGRVLQYQSLALLLDNLAILCLVRFGCNPGPRRGYAIAGGLVLAGAGLSALSAVFLLPVAVLALWPRVRAATRGTWKDLALWSWPLVPLLPAIGLAYLVLARATPASGQGGTEDGDSLNLGSFLLHYAVRFGEDRPYFNLTAFLQSANQYTSSLYLAVVLGAGLLIVLLALAQDLEDSIRRSGQTRAAALLALDVRNLAPAVMVGGLSGMLVTSKRRPLAWRLALLWLAAPLFTHLFLVHVPQTHWREIFPGLVLLVGGAAAGCYAAISSRAARVLALVAGGLFLAASMHYVYVAFVQSWPEYQLLYPLNRHPLDWSGLSFNSSGGTYGAAHRHGWKAVGELVARGDLPAEFATNERYPQAAWYLKRPPLCSDEARLFVRSARTRGDRQAIERGDAQAGFFLAGRVFVEGRPSLALLVREPPTAAPHAYQLDAYGWEFDRDLTLPWAPVGSMYRPSIDLPPDCGSQG